jgi:hypothetical protein
MAKKRDLKEQNPEYTIDLVEILAENDPSKSNKYLQFMIGQTAEWITWMTGEIKNETFKEMFGVIADFEDLSNRNLLENKDIYSYESPEDVVEAIKLAKEKVTRGEVKKRETEVIHEDDRWLVLVPLSHRSSNMYGKSTKWCVAGDDQDFKKYFTDYTSNGILVYVIDKSVKDKETRDNPLSKVAFHNKFGEGQTTAWDSRDSQLNVSAMMKFMSAVGGDIMDKVNAELEGGKTPAARLEERGVRI